MVYEELPILENAKLTAYRISRSHLDPDDPTGIRPAVLVLPGGGYSFTSDREAEPIALQYIARGMHAFVLRYSVMTKFPQSLLETAASIRLIREHAGEWDVDPNKIIVCGFSAGGHLAAMMAAFWHRGFLNELLGTEAEEIRPNGAILCYAVLSAKHPHSGSFENLLLEDDSPEARRSVSIDEQIDQYMPPCFLWHTFEDNCVPVEGVIEVMRALKENDISFEAHIWPHGSHGLALGTAETRCGDMKPDYPCSDWVDSSARWVRDL